MKKLLLSLMLLWALPLAAQPTPNVHNISSNYTVQYSDCGNEISNTVSSAITVTIPANVCFTGQSIIFQQILTSTGGLSIAAGSGVTLNGVSNNLITSGPYGQIVLRLDSGNNWVGSSSTVLPGFFLGSGNTNNSKGYWQCMFSGGGLSPCSFGWDFYTNSLASNTHFHADHNKFFFEADGTSAPIVIEHPMSQTTGTSTGAIDYWCFGNTNCLPGGSAQAILESWSAISGYADGTYTIPTGLPAANTTGVGSATGTYFCLAANNLSQWCFWPDNSQVQGVIGSTQIPWIDATDSAGVVALTLGDNLNTSSSTVIQSKTNLQKEVDCNGSAGSSGQVLTSGGAGAPCTWTSAPTQTASSATITLTGMSGTVTGTLSYVITGQMACISMPSLTGTSNATTFTATGVPIALAPAHAQLIPIVAENNGSNVFTAQMNAAPASTTITFYNSLNPSGWTASGTKGFPGTVTGCYAMN